MPPPSGFLKDFIEMRKQLSKSAPPASVAADNKAKNKRGGKTSDAMTGELTGLTLATIIEHKPGKKDVSEYFQRMGDALTQQKMK
jgi:hypothetical protein